jgi:hypothetical protein
MLRIKNDRKNQVTAPAAKNTETSGSSHEGVMIVPALTVSTLPYQVYGQTDARTTEPLAVIDPR